MDVQSMMAIASAVVAALSSAIAVWAAVSARRQALSALESVESAKAQVGIAREQLRLSQVSDRRARAVSYYENTLALLRAIDDWGGLLVKILADGDLRSDRVTDDLAALDELRVKVFDPWRTWLAVKVDGPFSGEVEILFEVVKRLVFVIDDAGRLTSRFFQLSPVDTRLVAEYAATSENYTLDFGLLAVQIMQHSGSLSMRLGEWISAAVDDADDSDDDVLDQPDDRTRSAPTADKREAPLPKHRRSNR